MKTLQKSHAVVTAVVFSLMFLFVPGCDSPEKYDPLINQQQEKQKLDEAVYRKYAAEIEQLNDAKNKLAAELAKAREEAKDTAVLEARIIQIETESKLKQAAATQVQKDQAVRELLIEELKKQQAAAGDIPRQISEGAKTASGFLPPPWDLIAVGASLIFGGISEKRKRDIKAAAVEAIGTMSTAISAGHVVMDKNAVELLRKSQSPAAKAIVGEAQAAYSDAMTLAKQTKAT